MRDKSEYMSDFFVNEVFPAFATGFKAKTTVNEYFSAICLYCDFMKKDFLDETFDDAMGYANYLQARIKDGKFATSTYIVRMSAYRAMEDFLMKFYPGTLTDTPWHKIQRPHLDSSISPERIPSIEQLDMLLERSKDLGPMWYVLIALVIRCALTATEVISLKKTDFQVEGDYMYLHLDTKRRDVKLTKERQLRLTDDVRELVEKHIATMPFCDEAGHLFYNSRKKALSQKNLQDNLHKIQADLPFCFSIGSIRSRAILELLAASSDPAAVAQFADISSMRIASFIEAAGLVDDKRAVNDFVNISVNSCF